jgi:hypothetical protein
MQLVRHVERGRSPGWLGRLAAITGVGTWVVIAYMVVFVVPQRVMCGFGESKVDVARVTVHRLATDTLVEPRDQMDPWGNHYIVTHPPAAGPPIISSAGEDGIFGTPDDLRSDQ